MGNPAAGNRYEKHRKPRVSESIQDYRGGLDRSGEGLLFIIHRTSTTNHGPPAYTHPLRIHIVLAYTHTLTGAYTHPMWMLHCVLANTHTHTDRSRMHPLRIRTRSRIRTYRSRIRTYPRIRTRRCNLSTRRDRRTSHVAHRNSHRPCDDSLSMACFDLVFMLVFQVLRGQRNKRAK